MPIKPDPVRHRLARRRPGYVYLAVLFTSLVVVASVAAALSISTASLATQNERNGRLSALRLAESEMQRWAAAMQTDARWRDDFKHDVFTNWYAPTIDGVAIESAQLRCRFSDADGDLADDAFDSVDLTVHARVGASTAALTATLEPDPFTYDMLRYSVTATDDLILEDGGDLSCENHIQVADDCKTSSYGSVTTPQLEVDDRMEVSLRGDRSSASLILPGRDVVGDYVLRGTEINVTSLPLINGRRVIRDVLLSPARNPFGATDAQGVYWLDAGGATVRIRHCRINATLVIRNAALIEVRDGIHWEFPTTADAILVTDSPIEFDGLNESLVESDRGVNFNPFGSPYRGVLADADTSDRYPTDLRGVIYSTSDIDFQWLDFDGRLHLTGAIICRDLRVEGSSLHVSQLDELFSDPPRGLSDPTPMRFVRGSFRRIPAPD